MLFVRASVEDLSEELDGVANEVHVHFPWGSLLRAVTTGDPTVLRSIRRVCAPRAWLEIVISFDPARDRTEIARLRLPPLSVEFLKTTLVPRYRAAGFEVVEHRRLSPSECSALRTTWTKRLSGGAARPVFCLIARCEPSPGERTKKRSRN